MDLLKEIKFKCSVSTVLNKDIKQHGKQNMFDQQEDTSWSSDKGTPQWITLALAEPNTIAGFRLQFQGGFSGQKSIVYMYSLDDNLIHSEAFYPEDINSPQSFKLNDITQRFSKIKFVFESSTDLFGRIIVYNLQVYS